MFLSYFSAAMAAREYILLLLVYIFSPGMYPSINLQNIFVSVIATSEVGNAFITNSMIYKYSSVLYIFTGDVSLY